MVETGKIEPKEFEGFNSVFGVPALRERSKMHIRIYDHLIKKDDIVFAKLYGEKDICVTVGESLQNVYMTFEDNIDRNKAFELLAEHLT